MTYALTTRGAGQVAHADPLTTTRQHEPVLHRSLGQQVEVCAHLIDLGELAIIRAELRNALATLAAPEREARAEVMALIGSYPQPPANLEIYLVAMASEASRWPMDVLREARRIITRRCRFPPTAAELAEACESIQARRRALLIAVERMEREHHRRAAAARLKAAHEDELQGSIDALHAKLRGLFGELAIDAQDFPHAQSGMRYAGNLQGDFQGRGAVAWLAAYQAAEAWAVIAARRASIFGRALRLHRTDVFSLGHLCTIGEALARAEEPAALRMIEQAESGTAHQIGRLPADRNTLRRYLAAALDRETCQRLAEAQ